MVLCIGVEVSWQRLYTARFVPKSLLDMNRVLLHIANKCFIHRPKIDSGTGWGRLSRFVRMRFTVGDDG